jgi:mutator protein MutT
MDKNINSKKHFRLPAAVYLILKKGNQILMQRRFNTGYADGLLSLPSGHIDGGESFEQAMIREAKEEINIDLSLPDLSLSKFVHRIEGAKEYIDIFFTAVKWRGEVFNAEPDKCSELVWRDIDDLPKDTIPYVRNVLLNKKDIYLSFGFEDKEFL